MGRVSFLGPFGNVCGGEAASAAEHRGCVWSRHSVFSHHMLQPRERSVLL